MARVSKLFENIVCESIRAKTTSFEDIDAMLTEILADLDKIDDKAVLGLLGVSNSLAYKIHEIERHLHSSGSWFEKASTPAGETHAADRIGEGAGAFQLDAGNDAWGGLGFTTRGGRYPGKGRSSLF